MLLSLYKLRLSKEIWNINVWLLKQRLFDGMQRIAAKIIKFEVMWQSSHNARTVDGS